MLGYIVHIINNTIRVTLYSMNKPQVLAMVDLLQVTVLVVGCYLPLPLIGVLAPAMRIFIETQQKIPTER